jgi:hypothetical protein
MAWLSNWNYRKSITLSRASGAVTNYQMKILVGESSGATGEDVDCGGLCATDFDDIRFTAADGTTVLDYWIESITGTTPNQLATIWIEFDSIGTGATTFYMYYGNSGAAAYSNGANTFIVFDDFERGSNGDAIGGSWTVVAGSAVISTEQAAGGTRSAKLVGGSTAPIITIPVTAGESIAIQWSAYKTAAAGASFGHSGVNSGPWTKWDTDETWQYVSVGYNLIGVSPTANAWHLFAYDDFNYSAHTNDYWCDNTKYKDNAGQRTADGLTDNKFYIEERGTTAGNNVYIDNFIVRNWRTTEPAWGSWGSEESVGAIVNDSVLLLISTEVKFAVPESSVLVLISDRLVYTTPDSSVLSLISGNVEGEHTGAVPDSSVLHLYSEAGFLAPEFVTGSGAVIASIFTVVVYSGNIGTVQIPVITIVAESTITTLAAGIVTYDKYTVLSYRGAEASVKESNFDFSGTMSVGTAPGLGGGNVKVPVPTIAGTAMVGILADGEVFFPAFSVLGGRTAGEVSGDGNVSFHFEVVGTAQVAKFANVALSYSGFEIEATGEIAREADGSIIIDQFTIAAIALSNNLCSSRLEHVR